MPVSPGDQSIDQPVTMEKNLPREFTGKMTLTGSDPSAGFMKEPDGKLILRGLKQTIQFDVIFKDGGADLLSGSGDLELNCNVDFAAGVGEWWGKLILTPTSDEAKGGQWIMTWHGKGILGSDGWTLPLKEVGHGNGGALTGLQCFMDNNIIAPADMSTWLGTESGYIKTH
ncbi:MAG: hypothetical protein M1480_10135 [Bacteroidetes bacterium]|nr:hypothetical protein [Bacteroidota bacterium]